MSQINFDRRHRWDGWFWAIFLSLAVAAILLGFRDPVERRFTGQADYVAPWALVVHVWSFAAWFVFVGMQAVLAARRRLRWHRRLGWALLPIVAVMTWSGLRAEIDSKAFYAPQYPSQIPLLASTLVELFSFTLLALAAFLARSRPAAHKRLIYLATATLATAAARRVYAPLLMPEDSGMIETLLIDPLGLYVLVSAAILYDLATRGRVHRALKLGGGFVILTAVVSIPVGQSDWWPPVARGLLGF